MSDTQRLELRLREFAAAPEDADWEDVLRRAGERLSARHFSRRRLALALAAAVVVVASLVGVFVTRGASPRESTGPSGPSGPLGPDTTFTMAHPLPVPGARQVSMSDAATALGGTIVLPDTPQVTPSDAGAVWMAQGHGDAKTETETTVRVTFPSQGLIIAYERPPVPDPLAYIRQSVKDVPGSRMIYLSGVPAWVLPEASDISSWDSIEFVAAGATIFLFSHTDEAFLQAVAKSIIDQANASG